MQHQTPKSTDTQRRVLIPVPNRNRDLEGHALIGYHLERTYGHQVLLDSMLNIYKHMLTFAPDAVLIDTLGTPSRLKLARLFRSLGIKVLLLPTAGFWHETESEARRAGVPNQPDQMLHRVLVWGPWSRDILQPYFAPEKLEVVGCPRFDLYSQPYLSLIPNREDFLGELGIATPRAPLIVWTTNTYFNRIATLPSDMQSAGATSPAAVRLEAEVHEEKLQYEQVSAIIIDLSSRHRDWNFLIKVHPSEEVAPYQKLAAQHPNMYVTKSAPIRNVLYHTDVLVQRASTTSTEAWMLGKPVLDIATRPYNLPTSEEYLAGCDVITDLASAETLASKYLHGATISPMQQRARDLYLNRRYYRIDGNASLRCAQAIHELIVPPHHSDYQHRLMEAVVQSAAIGWHRQQDRRLSNRIKKLLGVNLNTSLRFWSHRKRNEPWLQPISQAEIAQLYGRYEQALQLLSMVTSAR